jgi:hypothetical protein
MKRLPFYALLSFFVLLYTQGLWSRVGTPKLVIDALLSILPLAVLLSQPGILYRPAPGFLLIWFYLGWSLSACLYNDEGAVRGLLYPRFLVASYLVFWAIWNSHFTRGQLLRINTVILTMLLVQVPASLFNWLVLSGKVEAIVGTMAYGTGGIATTLPMFAFGGMLALFLHYNKPIFLVAGFSFFLVGYASGKLAVYYFVPLLLVLGLMLYAVQEGLPSALRRSRVVVLCAACALPFLVLLLSGTHRAESLQGETGLYKKIAAFVNYTQQTAIEDRSWYTTTRLGTSRRVVEETFRREPSVFLFGQGTRVFQSMSGEADEGAYDKYGIIYGTVGWSHDALAVGWPAMFAHAAFYTYLFWLLLRQKDAGALDPCWKAIRLTEQLGFFVFVIVYFTYSIHFTVGGWLSSVYLYFLAVLLAPQYQEILRTGSTEEDEDMPPYPRRRWGHYLGDRAGWGGDLVQE